jgi:hypothetical protein
MMMLAFVSAGGLVALRSVRMLSCLVSGHHAASCQDLSAPSVNRLCQCSPGWQNYSTVVLDGVVVHTYSNASISDS